MNSIQEDIKVNKSSLIIITLLSINILFYIYSMRYFVDSKSTDGVIYKKENNTKKGNFKKCKNNYTEYCINGKCIHIQDLNKFVCVCDKGFSGIRCQIKNSNNDY